ncbi:GDP-mannose 4,6-dehydratase [Proteus mirabilis]|uniref:GDP-mannose 4,6-dehydratase n=1 Tax=Proteus mirabilis TaxID=584 RepID=UPI001B376E97|nr:GDP-mannose 4,6-dehydratase [Proteus mirabilis]MBQ0523001.1 GDP-mannose 4,6-dehydratase [Proteus mirabilis]
MKYLITGCAGFIGFKLSHCLLQSGHSLIGIDNINNYYDQNLKNSRLNILKKLSNFNFIPLDIIDSKSIRGCPR